jgi:fibro-slime domain-containing protein
MLFGLIACGPSPREIEEPAGADANAQPDATAPVDPVPSDAPLACGQIVATFRDFKSTHPDFQRGVGIDPGIAAALLGTDGKPVYAGVASTSTVTDAASFAQWYRDMPNINATTHGVLTLVEGPPGTFSYDNQSFFPLDGLGFGNETNPHNYHFTTEIHTTFTYKGGELFTFSGDDDVFVFVNGHLAIDLGGVHDPLTGTIDFDARAGEFGLTIGNSYPLDVFHAERHTVASTFKMTTTIDCLVVF